VYQVEEKKLKKKVIDLEIREGWSREFVEKVTEIMENNAVGVLDKELYEKLKEEYPDIDERLAKIKQFKDENKIVVSFDLSRKIDYFLEEPRYKTQFETGTSGGTLDKAKRNEWETIIAGKKTESWIEDKERPVYGVIADISTKSIPSARYGGSYFILKDEVRKRATYTIGNSSYEQGSFIDDPIAMLNKKNIPDRETGASFAVYFADGITKGSLEQHSYLETQIWGGIDLLKDVEMLVVPKENAFLPIANRDYDFISGNMKERYKKREPVTGKIVKEFTDKENSSNIKKWEAFVKMLEDSDVKVVIK
jgi:hypothetical protein